MIKRFFAWYVEQLRGLLPAQLAGLSRRDSDAVILSQATDMPEAIDLGLRRSGRLSGLGRFALDASGLRQLHRALDVAKRPQSLLLRLPARVLLEKTLALPLAAERDLARVLAFEMDRETPFTADEVWADWAVEERDRAQGRMRVRLSVVPKVAIASLLELLNQAGLQPVGLEVSSPNGGLRRLDLDLAHRVPPAWYARSVSIASLACLLLLAAVVVMPFIRQAIALEEVEQQIADLQPPVREAEALRRRLDGSGAGGEILNAERARLGDALRVLAATTDALPDDTHLVDLTLRARRLSLVGQSGAAAQLIATLSNQALFINPAFTSPVTRLEGSRLDIFTLGTEVRP